MALTKVKITVNSTVKNEDDPLPEYTSESYLGHIKHTEREGVVHVAYKSESEGAVTETRAEIFDDAVRLVRFGAIESNMLFEVGHEHTSVYKIPPFSFDMTLSTERIQNSLSPLGGTLTLKYVMTVGGAKKDCLMKISVTPV